MIGVRAMRLPSERPWPMRLVLALGLLALRVPDRTAKE